LSNVTAKHTKGFAEQKKVFLFFPNSYQHGWLVNIGMEHVQQMQRKTAGVISTRTAATLLLLVFALCPLADVLASADSINVLSCYDIHEFNASSIANNTQFVISGCDGSGQGTAFFATMLVITYPVVTPPLANISILVQSCVSATVTVNGESAAPTIHGLSITMRNVTNPASPGPPASLNCSISWHP
jgi:hypothetical protein